MKLKQHSVESTDDEREDRARTWLVEQTSVPFDLSAEHPFRAALLRLGESDHVLLLTTHHIASDAWSVGVMQREWPALYRARLEGREGQLEDLPIQYADYAAWERDEGQLARAEAQLVEWKEHLVDVPSLELPLDRPRPLAWVSQGARVQFTLDESLTTALHALAREQGGTLFMVLLAGFVAMLSRLSGQSDFAIGTPVAHRTQRETEFLVGLFSNTLVLRFGELEELSVRQLLGRVRAESLGAFSHQDVLFERLVDQTSRDTSRFPLVQAIFVLQNAPREEPALEAAEMERFPFDPGTAKLDIEFSVTETAGRLVCHFEYATALFDSATVARWAGYLERLLRAMVAQPDHAVQSLPMLADEERQRVLVEWNATTEDYPHDATLHALIGAQAARNPDAVAVIGRSERLTYGMLDAQSNVLARQLQRAGVGPDKLVGVCLQRSSAMLVALLAVLKAGGAYVPLDPSYPRERLAFMLDDANVALVLTDASSQKALPPESGTPQWLVEELPTGDRAPVEGGATPRNLAYVIYTSGSTGLPKGVAVTARSVVNLLLSLRRRTGFASSDVLLAVTSLSFDIAGLELFMPLLTGATVVVADRDATFDGRALRRLVETFSVTFIQATPLTWRLLLEAGLGPDSNVSALCGGEALPLPLAVQLRDTTRAAWNVYGPTET